MKTCLYILLLVLLTLAVGWATDPAPTPSPKPIELGDRILVREAQLSLAQAHIARLQAEAQVRQAQDSLGELLSTLKTRYSCQGCELNSDFTWVQPPKTTPAPNAASGQSSDKE